MTHTGLSDKDVIHCLSSFAPSLTSTWRVDLKKNAKTFKSRGWNGLSAEQVWQPCRQRPAAFNLQFVSLSSQDILFI